MGGDITGTAEAGDVPPTESELRGSMEHAKRYDGKTELSVTYTIVLKADNSVDPTKSTVQFTCVHYTSSGTPNKKSDWKTHPVPITAVVLTPGGQVSSFEFQGTKWYPGMPDGQQNGLSGKIDVTNKTGEFKGSYVQKFPGGRKAVYTYTVKGAPPPANPFPPEDLRGDEVFAPLALVNEEVSFVPDKSTYTTTRSGTGCPSGFSSTFSFSARLTNTRRTELFLLAAQVFELTNGVLVQNADGGPGGVGAFVTIPLLGMFADGNLSPEEYVDVRFVMCLTRVRPFSFRVDVLGLSAPEPVVVVGATISTSR
jgi:hypothetical protein